jgi:citronellyl-CoA dehydrogenase
MEKAVRDAIRYGTERSAFGKPLTKHQVWRHKLVEHLTSIEAARRLCYFAVDKVAKDPFASTREITMAKLFAGDLMQKVLYDCQQLHGGFGYVTEYPISRAWTDGRLLTIGGGTSEIMKEILTKLENL